MHGSDRARVVAVMMLLVAAASLAATDDPCSAASSSPDLRLVLSVKGGRTEFQEGEIVPLVLSFTSSAKNRYWADVRNYDRSGRLGIETYCVDPEAPDPLAAYPSGGIGGGLGTTRELGAAPFLAEAELNEWRSLPPGRYRVYAVSRRVWRPADRGERIPYDRVDEVVRSNAVAFEVKPADPAWQNEQLRTAVLTYATAQSPVERRRAARVLRFLNTRESARELARLFVEVTQPQEAGADLMFGLWGSPYRDLAIEALRRAMAAPEHAATIDALRTVVDLQAAADADWGRRQEHARELMKTETERVVAALPRKTRGARAVTLTALLLGGSLDRADAEAVRPALAEAWSDLPRDMQRELIELRWPLIAGPEMLPVLRRIVAEPPPGERTLAAMTRDAALRNIFELDPGAGRELILRDALDRRAHPSLELIEMLSPQDAAVVVGPAVERIRQNDARELDFELLDRFGDGVFLGVIQAAFEPLLGKWACAPQAAILRYFLRVEPAYGALQVSASLAATEHTRCFTTLLGSLETQFPKVQAIAIEALDDHESELVQDAARALGRWGTAEAEAALWERLRRFRREWAGREDQLRTSPDFRSAGSRGVAVEDALVSAIAQGTNWLCGPDKLARLAALAASERQRERIAGWMKQWGQQVALIIPSWSSPRDLKYSLLQYEMITEAQLRSKLANLPTGKRLVWQFWPPGRIFPSVAMAVQEERYERVRAVAEENGIALEKGDYR